MGLRLNGAEALVTQGIEKTKVPNDTLGSVFTSKRGLQKSKDSNMRGKAYPW